MENKKEKRETEEEQEDISPMQDILNNSLKEDEYLDLKSSMRSKNIRQDGESTKPHFRESLPDDHSHIKPKRLIDYQQKPQKKVVQEYVKEVNTNPILKEEHKKIVDTRSDLLWKIIAIIGIAAFVYVAATGSFKSDYSQPYNINVSQPDVYVNATSPVQNTINNNFTIENNVNATLKLSKDFEDALIIILNNTNSS